MLFSETHFHVNIAVNIGVSQTVCALDSFQLTFYIHIPFLSLILITLSNLIVILLRSLTVIS